MSKADKSMVRGFLRRARKLEAPLLATVLHRYAEAEAMSWDELARSLGCSAEALDQVALCRPPRDECFVQDVEAIAAGYMDSTRLLFLLRRLQVLGTLAGAPAPGSSIAEAAAASPAIFLAARLYESDALFDLEAEEATEAEEAEGPDEAEELEVEERGEPTEPTAGGTGRDTDA